MVSLSNYTLGIVNQIATIQSPLEKRGSTGSPRTRSGCHIYQNQENPGPHMDVTTHKANELLTTPVQDLL